MNKAILRLALTAPGAKAYAAALGLVRGSFLMIRGVPTERALAGTAAGRQATKAAGRTGAPVVRACADRGGRGRRAGYLE